jgi:hypothetical protein
MRQMFVAVVLLVGLVACGKKSEPEKTAPAALNNAQPSDPSPAGRAAENPTATADKPKEAKPKDPAAQAAHDREAIRAKIKARADKMAPPVDPKLDPSGHTK